jgi:hypothetical protein
MSQQSTNTQIEGSSENKQVVVANKSLSALITKAVHSNSARTLELWHRDDYYDDGSRDGLVENQNLRHSWKQPSSHGSTAVQCLRSWGNYGGKFRIHGCHFGGFETCWWVYQALLKWDGGMGAVSTFSSGVGWRGNTWRVLVVIDESWAIVSRWMRECIMRRIGWLGTMQQ